MNTYLVTWNPANWPWDRLDEMARTTERGVIVDDEDMWWNVANSKVSRGARLFLIKQGDQLPKGIMASGWATSDVKHRPHYKPDLAKLGKQIQYVDAEWDVILNHEREPLLQVATIDSEGMPKVNWRTQSSGILIDAGVAARLEVLWVVHLGQIRGFRSSEEIELESDAIGFPEGKALYSLHCTIERNSNLVKHAKSRALLRDGKLVCAVCSFDYFAAYGEVGRDYIECHHTIPVSELKEGMTTKLTDVALVCSNCHRMLHRKRPWLGMNELRKLLKA